MRLVSQFSISILAAFLAFGCASTNVAEKPQAAIAAPVDHARVLPLEGGRNFRDIGGYRTADGRMVKWDKVFRSGSLTSLTDKDYAALAPLGIQTVVDFRIDYERAAEPTTWRAGTPDILVKANSQGGGDSETFAKALMNPNATPESVRATMIEFYRQMPEQYADQYAVLFKRLAALDAPVLFNCTAGKDRTGIAAALVLTSLGVPRQTVIDDYAISEKVVDYGALLDAPAGASGSASLDALRKLPREVVMPIFRSDPAYIVAALTQIETVYGTVDGYLIKRLGLTDAELKTMRARLLQ